MSLSRKEARVLGLASLGGALEFYDFIIFIFVIIHLGPYFFPLESEFFILMLGFLMYAVTYFVKPLGGIIFGHFGDKYGRKSAFYYTLIMMAVPTFSLGLLPTYETIGWLAPALLLFLRILQGLAIGGEVPGALTFAVEHVSPKQRSFACASIFFGITLGMFLGQAVVIGLQQLLTPQGFIEWGWRLAFFLGGLLGIASVYLRVKLQETPEFVALNRENVTNYPLVTMLKQSFGSFLRGIGLMVISIIMVNQFIIVFPAFLHFSKLYTLELQTLEFLNLANIIILGLFTLLCGYLADKFGQAKLYTWGAWLILLLIYPLMFSLTRGNVFVLITVITIVAWLTAMVTASAPALLANLYPTAIRFTGIAMSFNFSHAFFGGPAPAITAGLMEWTGRITTPAFFIIACALLAIISVRALNKREKEDQNGTMEAQSQTC